MGFRYLKISPISNFRNPKNNVSFGEARVNILAMGDSHGQIESLPAAFDAIEYKKAEIFDTPKEKTTDKPQMPKNYLNLFTHAGDYFINPAKRGFIGDPNATAASNQVKLLNSFLTELKKDAPDLEGYYTLGNHCLDDGDELAVKELSKADVTTLLTNVNLRNSKSITDLSEKDQEKFKEQAILEIPDDKNPNLKHKVLMLGMTTPSVDFYVPNQVKGLDIIDRNAKKDVQLTEKDFTKSYEKLNKTIGDFKKDNPKGAVVLLSHNGNAVADMIVKNVSGIDVIINGHDHKKENHIATNPTTGHQTLVASMYQNNRKFSSIKLHFDDDGNLDTIKNKDFYTEDVEKEKKAQAATNPIEAGKKEVNPIQEKLNALLGEDFKPSVFLSGPTNIESLSTDGIRNSSNLLANFTSDVVKEQYEKHGGEADIVGLQTASIRQNLPVNGWTSNIKLLNLFCGRTVALGALQKGELKGAEITKFVIENYGDNMKNRNRNPLVQYSGMKVNKGQFDNLLMSGNATMKDYADCLEVKDKEGKYQKLDLEKTYKVALPEELFVVPNVKTLMNMKDKFQPTGYNADDLFMEYVKDNDYKISMDKSADVRVVE